MPQGGGKDSKQGSLGGVEVLTSKHPTGGSLEKLKQKKTNLSYTNLAKKRARDGWFLSGRFFLRSFFFKSWLDFRILIFCAKIKESRWLMWSFPTYRVFNFSSNLQICSLFFAFHWTCSSGFWWDSFTFSDSSNPPIPWKKCLKISRFQAENE